jgi:hypothetical protein
LKIEGLLKRGIIKVIIFVKEIRLVIYQLKKLKSIKTSRFGNEY